MKKICLLLSLSVFAGVSFSQGFNSNYQKSYINIAIPKTPESQSFEKYGNIPVDEYSGTPNISVPLYNVKGRFLESPVSLSYHASGIKVNQEATWVGLGFDLMYGGRITVETKGNVDDNARYYTTQQMFKDGLKRIFNKWKSVYDPSPNASKLGYAFIDYGKAWGKSEAYFHKNDTLWDDNFTVSNATWYGIGEPDIYHANFMGNSINFYTDLVDGKVKVLGEKTHFYIYIQRDSLGYISTFSITDNSGIRYLFEQKESTKLSIPPNYGWGSYVSSNSAWLLTKIIHPSADTISFTYTNFGKTYPAFTWSASISCNYPYTGTFISDGIQNTIEQEPYYLSKIESGTTTMDFIMSSREDLRGTGARKLDRIDVKDRISSMLIKQIEFTYNYFTTNLEAYENSQPDTIKSYYGKRLQLLSVKENSSSEAKPWFFYYKNLVGPSKLSFAQDHWGFYNGVNNTTGYTPNPASPLNLIPRFEELGNLATRVIQGPIYMNTNFVSGNVCFDGQTYSGQIHTSFNGLAQSRNCSPTYMLAFMMDSIVYPTGGATKFEYEPHHSVYSDKSISDFVGGGLRVKSIKNYALSGNLENCIEYDYMNSGVYLGAIEYIRVTNKWPSANSITMSASGELNGDNLTIGYASVKKTVKDNNNKANNGYTIKYYYVSAPLPVEYTSVLHPFSQESNLNPIVDKNSLIKKQSGNAPMPKRELDGKLYKEEAFDNLNNMVKTVNYYYRQAEFSNQFYSLKAFDHYDGYFGGIANLLNMCPCTGICTEPGTPVYEDMGWGMNSGPDNVPYKAWRRWEVCITPAVSFYTVLDSMTERTLDLNGNYITTKKAFTYNKYYQQEFATTFNTGGTQTISYTKTPLSFDHPPVPSGGENNAYLIEQLKSSHIYDVPIEQISIRRNTYGDSLVTSGVYNVYEYSTLKKVYILETNSPLQFRTQFVPTYYYYNYPTLPSFDVVIDNKYKLQDSAEYYSCNLIRDITAIKGKQSYIWDESYNTLLASCVDAVSSDIAFTSFETNAKGNWSYTGTPVADTFSPTGAKAYFLSNGTISKTFLNVSKTYLVSYWSKNGSQNVNGTTATSGRSLNGYTYYEHKVVNPASGTITVSGSGTIDELRLYPDKTLMTTYTYKPLIGISVYCDANNRISYYEYDSFNRLKLIRDQDGNIIKTIDYHYKQ
jgi:hypothetical protein